MSSPLRSAPRLALGLSLSLAVGSCESPRAATEVVARIDSDLAVGSELTRVEAHVFSADGAREELGNAEFTLSGDEARVGGDTLPLSFSVAPHGADSTRRFRLVVAGYGRSAPDLPEILQVERQVITAFRPHRALRVDVFLGRICLGELCREAGDDDAALTCGDDGQCGAVPVVSGSPDVAQIDRDPALGSDGGELDGGLSSSPDAGSTESPDAEPLGGLDASAAEDDSAVVVTEPDASAEPDAGCGPAGCTCTAGFMSTAAGCVDIDECLLPSSNTCTPSSLCAQTVAPGYTCTGQLADWPMPDTALGVRSLAPIYSVSGEVVDDEVTGLSWQRSVDPNSTRTAAAADAYCAALAQGPYEDWRVPSRIELASLLDTVHAAPLIDATAFPSTPSAFFWTRDAQRAGAHWAFSFATGLNAAFGVDEALLVRCVRSGTVSPGTPASRYVTDTSAGTITDTRTTLVWQRGVSSVPSTYAAAVMSCAASGRRLPSLKELLTLIDPTRTSPANDPVFPPSPPRAFWSSSVVPGSPGQVYVVSSDVGSVSTANSADGSTLAVRCVTRP